MQAAQQIQRSLETIPNSDPCKVAALSLSSFLNSWKYNASSGLGNITAVIRGLPQPGSTEWRGVSLMPIEGQMALTLTLSKAELCDRFFPIIAEPLSTLTELEVGHW